MKRKSGSLLLAAAALVYGNAPAQTVRKTAPSNPKALITVMNPAVASKMAPRLPLSPRLDTLQGKTLYMVDINWGGPEAAYSVFQEMQDWFARNMPGVKTVLKRKRGAYSADDPELWKEIGKNGDAAIVGISG